MEFAIGAASDWKLGGGGAHAPALEPLGLETSALHPKFPSFDWEGAQQCFILCDQTTGDLKSHHLQARVTLTALSVPPTHTATFSYSNQDILWLQKPLPEGGGVPLRPRSALQTALTRASNMVLKGSV